jgi:DNA-binding response OmpR family regulator
MTTTHRVLVAEEDETCRAFLVENLTADGYAVDVATSRQDAICSLRHDSPNLVLVDVNASTLALVDWIRAGDDTLGARATDTPIVVAGSHTSEIDRVRLLDRGADDVVSKPYSYPELRARIVAVLRRTQPRQPRPVTVAGPVRINHRTRTVRVRQREVVLSDIEYRLLCRLASDPTRVFTRQELMRDVWGCECESRTRTLDSHAYRLRRRLASDTPLIVDLRGVGYRPVAAA